MSALDIIGLSLAGVLFALALILPFVKSERERNMPWLAEGNEPLPAEEAQ